jgi:predicted RNA-binding Zn ribbon-like protein
MAKIQTNQVNWKFVGGRLCLDFINTVGGRSGAAVLRDKLVDYSDLLEWTRLAGIANPTESRNLARRAAAHRHEAEGILRRAVQLREALYLIFKSAAEGRRPRSADLDTVSQELRMARARERLTHTGGAFAWTWQNGETALDRILWPVSLSAADLLTSGDLSRLRQCGGHECGWMFLDTSRNRSRHWCDMKDCGNRAKVSRFRQRHQQSRRRARSA